MEHWTTRMNIEKEQRDRIIAMAALSGYSIGHWCTGRDEGWEVRDPQGKPWTIAFSSLYGASLAVCRELGAQL